jgi:hypothetical protein
MKVLPDRHTLAGSLKISLEKLANEVGVLKSQHTAGSLNGFTLFCTRASFSTRVINEPATSQRRADDGGETASRPKGGEQKRSFCGLKIPSHAQ